MNTPAQRAWFWAAALGLLFLGAGCLTGRPPPVQIPQVDAAAAGQNAVKAYDTNGDGALDAAEIAAGCPGILGATGKGLAKWDTNGDGKVAADEIAGRVQSWYKDTGLMNFSCIIKLDGKPLEGANVVLEPEPFLGGAIKPCSGTTNATGNVTLAVKLEDLPPADRMVGVVQPGIYKVRITHPTIKVPERYNTATTLGQVITTNDPESQEQVVFELTSK